MKQVWLITGASRGLGLEMARAVLKAGHQVVATARRPAEIEKALGGYGGQMLAAQMDVTQPESVDAAVASAIERFGRIDVLVNNAGYGQLGWFEAISDAQTRRQFETNVFGAMQVTRAVLPTMRRQRSGHVITISSVAGLIAVAGASIYAASKFAVEGWMEALAAELKPLGIAATVIEPGFFRTDFLDATSVSYGDIEIPEYAEQTAAFKEFHDNMNHQQIGDPAKLGALLLDLVAMKEPPMRLAVGSDAAEYAQQKGESSRSNAEQLQALSASTDGDAPAASPELLGLGK